MARLISIITPVYNHEKYIGECIESVLAQTYQDWEMIIVDDGSTDGTPEAAANYKDKRIRYIRQENKGIWKLNEVYNRALSEAKGELIAILEGDDYWSHYKLGLQERDFDDKDIILSYGYTQIITEKGPKNAIPPESLPDDAKINTPVGRAALSMMNPDFLTFTFPVSVLIRRTVLERIGGFLQPPYLPLVDYPTFLRLSLEGRFAFHNKVLAYWRRHSASSSNRLYPLILSGVDRYKSEFLKEFGPFFSDDEKDRVFSDVAKNQSFRLALLGRLMLKEREWKNARLAFKKGLELPCGLQRASLMKLGIALSYLHADYDRVFDVLGLGSIYKILSNFQDPIVSKEMLNTFRDHNG